MNIKVSGYYKLFWGALQRQKNELQKIIYEIENFKFSEEKISELISNTILELSEDEAKELILMDHFTFRTSDTRVSIILFSSFYIEGLFNEYLAIKSGNKKEFENTITKISPSTNKKRRVTFLEKVMEAPKKINPLYNVPIKLQKQTEELIRRRNYFAHNESEIIKNGELFFQGKKLDRNEGYKELFQWTELPRLLHENLIQFETEDYSINSFVLKSRIEYTKNHYVKDEQLEEIGKRYINN